MKNELMAGQAEDMFLGEVKRMPSRQRIMRMMMKKSAGYSAEKPLILGAALAGAGKKYFNLFKRIAIPLGLAFQLQDDVLGMFGKRKEVGKPTDSDIKEGKVTLLIYYALESGKFPKVYLRKILGNESASPKQVGAFKRSIKECGALEKINAEIENYISEAKEVVRKSALLRKENKDILIGLADFLQGRAY
jgi:geranylgeranyl diphosphate synthase type I